MSAALQELLKHIGRIASDWDASERLALPLRAGIALAQYEPDIAAEIAAAVDEAAYGDITAAANDARSLANELSQTWRETRR